MEKIISWLSRNQLINILLATAFFLAVVVFHDEITLLAIQLRRRLSVEGYNLFFTIASIIFFFIWTAWIYISVKRRRNFPDASVFLAPTLLMIAVFFIFMQTYAIEAVHFFQYAIMALLLFPLLGSYGATVFWATFLGFLDELYQYIILTPNFHYLDFNDILLNLLGAGLAVVTIHLTTLQEISATTSASRMKSVLYFSLTVIIAFTVAYLSGLIRWYPGTADDQPLWFAINRTPPSATFWTEPYKGKFFHVLRPWEGITLGVIFIAFYYSLDWKSKQMSTKNETDEPVYEIPDKRH